jgi:hypothetical protein
LFALQASHRKNHISGSYKRTITNVGLPTSTYRAIVTVSNGLNVSAKPDVLSFSSLREWQTYVLTIDEVLKESIGSASLVWDDGKFQVRSPIIVHDDWSGKSLTSPNLYVRVVVIVMLLLFMYLLFYIEKMYVIVEEYEMMLEYTFTSVCSLYLEII